MADEAWPDLRIPAPRGPTARAHLEQIQRAVRRARPAKQGVIEKAISACLSGRCLQGGDTPHEGAPPPFDEHGTSILAARAHAAEAAWDDCVAALRHGKASPGRTKGAKSERP